MKKIQVGENVWIKPSSYKALELGSVYYYLVQTGHVRSFFCHGDDFDYAFMNSGNFFLTEEEAKAAIIKPVDKTPITYDQWVAAGKPQEAFLVFGGEVCVTRLKARLPLDFATHKIWLTREAALAWIDDFNAKHPSES